MMSGLSLLYHYFDNHRHCPLIMTKPLHGWAKRAIMSLREGEKQDDSTSSAVIVSEAEQAGLSMIQDVGKTGLETKNEKKEGD